MANDGELKGGYAEDTSVLGNLDQADFNDLMTRQLVQYAVTAQQQLHQAALEDQRRMANAVQLLTLAQLGKGATSFPKSVVENVEHMSKVTSDDNLDDTSSGTITGMVTMDQFSKVTDAIEKLGAQIETQMAGQQSQFISAFEALLGRLEIEGE